MSELKAYGIRVIDGLIVESESGQLYIKSEADKVIAEKDSEIRRLENLCESYRIDCDNIAIREANTYKEIERDNKQLRHHKYKRCLAMADGLTWEFNYIVDYVSSDFPNIRFKRIHRLKWINKWLELAEQFKDKEEAK